MSSPLPQRPCLEQYKRQAKDLAVAARKGEPAALETLREHHAAALAKPQLRLSDAQHAIARSAGFASWPKLRQAILVAEVDAFFADIAACNVESAERWLSTRPALAQATNADGATALHVAAENGCAALAGLLVRHGADVSRRYGFSAHTPLSWAVTVGDFAFATEMVRLGDRPDLFSAAGIGDLELVKQFWPNGGLIPSPSQTGSSRFTKEGERLPRPPESTEDQLSDALYMAARHGRAEVAEWLLAHGADPNFRGYIGGTCLHWAEFSGDKRTAEMIRAAGGSDELRDYEYEATPRAFAVVVPAAWGLLGHLAARLAENPANATIQGARWTPLEAAEHSGSREAVELLRRYGAER